MGPGDLESETSGYATETKKLKVGFDVGILLISLLVISTAYVLAKLS